MSESNPQETPCLNCGAAVMGAYCHLCGQKVIEDPTLASWLAEVLESLTDLDSKLIRTLSIVFTRPGKVARLYIEGKRATYVAPLRLFVFASAIVIPIMVATNWFEKVISGDEFRQHTELLSVIFPALNLISPFIAAIVLKLLIPRTPIYHHLVLALYFGTGIVILGLPLVIDPTHWLSISYQVLLMCGYSFLSIRDCYQFALWKTIAVTAGFLALWQVGWQVLVFLALNAVAT